MLGVLSELGTALSPGAGQEDHLSAAVLLSIHVSSLSLVSWCAWVSVLDTHLRTLLPRPTFEYLP